MSEELGESDELAMEVVSEAMESENKEPWFNHAAFSSMLIAMVMTIGALFAGISVDEATTQQLDQLLDKGEEDFELLLKEIYQTRLVLAGDDEAEVLKLEKAMETFQEIAQEDQSTSEEDRHESDEIYRAHEVLAFGVSILSISVTLVGMSIVVRMKKVWGAALLIAVVGTGVVLMGLVQFFTA